MAHNPPPVLISRGKTQKTNKNRKYGRARKKCERYRARIGKPRGPGKPGNKAGKNKIPSEGTSLAR